MPVHILHWVIASQIWTISARRILGVMVRLMMKI